MILRQPAERQGGTADSDGATRSTNLFAVMRLRFFYLAEEVKND
jgi:hypothetical protein